MTTSNTSRISVWLCGLLSALALALAAAPAAAQSDADKQKAKQLYQRGKTQFDLGNFDEAVRLFKEAYATSPHPAFLFNVAQAYRQTGDCKQALFFYKRYLTVAGDKATNRELVEDHIEELTRTCEANEEMKSKPPLGAMSPAEDEPGGGDPGQGDPDAGGSRVASMHGEDTGGDGAVAAIARPAPRKPSSVLSAALEVGPALLQISGLEVTGAQFSITGSAGYPVEFGSFGLSVGGLFSLTPVPWSYEGMSQTSWLSSLLVNVGARYWVLDRLAVRGELGLGGQFLSGLGMGSVFLPAGAESTGALSMFNMRVGVGAEYLISDSLAVSVSPFIYSMSPGRDDLRDDIDTLGRIEFLAGVGYRL